LPSAGFKTGRWGVAWAGRGGRLAELRVREDLYRRLVELAGREGLGVEVLLERALEVRFRRRAPSTRFR
jgi:hypothetical protein